MPSGSYGGPVPSALLLTFNNGKNRVDQWAYDAAGDVTNDTNNMYAYDAEGHQTAAVNSLTMGLTGYIYDAEGRRVEKVVGNGWNTPTPTTTVENEYLLGLGGEQVTVLGPDAAWQWTNVYAGGRQLATYNGANTYFALTDWLGTKREELSITAPSTVSVAEQCLSLPYGDGLNCTGTDANQLHFTGKERDQESGNDYFGARYYANSMGRWLSPDPSGQYFANPENPQTWDLYAYVANNPLVNVDPFGLWIWGMGNCYFDTVKASVTAGGQTSFQGYDTQLLGCFDQPGQPSTPQQSTPPKRPHLPPQIDCSNPPPLPPTPSGANIKANEQATKKHGFVWWLMQVRPGGNWDYKKGGQQQYAAFGNVNFGATCNDGLGHTLGFCQRGAGAAAYWTAIGNVREGNNWTAGPGNPMGSSANDNGMPDYGDQATGTENQAVIAGFGYAQWQKACQQQ